MKYIVGVIVIAVMVAALGKTGILKRMLAQRGDASKPKLPYRRKDYLLTKAERAFYEVLKHCIGEDLLIFAKVRAMDLVWLPKGTANAQSYRNRIQSKHVDFILCTKDSLTPKLVIELNDKTHQRADRQQRDVLLADIFKACDLAYLPVRARQTYNTRELSRQIAEAIEGQFVESIPVSPAK